MTGSIIDADTLRAHDAMQTVCRDIQKGVFADVEPFDPEKFLSGNEISGPSCVECGNTPIYRGNVCIKCWNVAHD